MVKFFLRKSRLPRLVLLGRQSLEAVMKNSSILEPVGTCGAGIGWDSLVFSPGGQWVEGGG